MGQTVLFIDSTIPMPFFPIDGNHRSKSGVSKRFADGATSSHTLPARQMTMSSSKVHFALKHRRPALHASSQHDARHAIEGW